MRRRKGKYDRFLPVTKRMREALYKVQKGRCLACSKPLKLESDNPWQRFEMSHIVGLGRGGQRHFPGATRTEFGVVVLLNSRPNLEGLCKDCHAQHERRGGWAYLDKHVARYQRNFRGWPPSAGFERFVRRIWDEFLLDPHLLERVLSEARPRHKKFRCKALCYPPPPEDPSIEWPHDGLVRCRWTRGHRGPHRLVMSDGEHGAGAAMQLEVDAYDVERYLPRLTEPCERCGGSGNTLSGHKCEDCDGRGYFSREIVK